MLRSTGRALTLAGLVLMLAPFWTAAQTGETRLPEWRYLRSKVSATFDELAEGRGYINLDDLPEGERNQFKLYLLRNGVRNGRLTRRLYLSYMEEQYYKFLENEKRKREWEAAQAAGQQPGGRKKLSDGERVAQAERQAEEQFRKLDRNGDGYLEPDEMGPAERGQARNLDTDGDGRISLDEMKAFIRRWVAPNYRPPGSPGPFKPRPIKLDASPLEQRPTVLRRGTLPEELTKSWFAQADSDRDGQIGLYEWRAAGKELAEFEEYDRNGDGFLIAEELLFYLRNHSEKDADTDPDQERDDPPTSGQAPSTTGQSPPTSTPLPPGTGQLPPGGGQ